MTALSMIQTAAAWLSLPIPASAFSATDAQTIQLRSLLNEELVELRKWGDVYWRKLLTQYTFITTATEIQATGLPSDFDYMVPDSMWDRTTVRPVAGPIDPQQWQAWKARPILSSVVYGYRLRGNDFLIAPNPPAGDTVAYEYISTFAVNASGGTTPTKPEFTADTDTSIFNETMMERGLRWRFLSAKGLPYQQQYQEWISLVQREAGRSKGIPTLSAAGPLWNSLAGPYVPDGSWPG